MAEKYELTFGKYQGTTLGKLRKLDFKYLRWLAGYEYNGTHCTHDPFEVAVNRIGDYVNCTCSDLPNHERTCHGYVIGETSDETRVNLECLNGEWDFADLDMAWFNTVRLHWQAVYMARTLIDEKKLCWKCGAVMTPIGRARKRGKRTHDDWESRTFHKKCFTKVKYNY